MPIEAVSQTNLYQSYILSNSDELNVGAGVVLRSTFTDPVQRTGADVIIGWTGTHRITVAGEIHGADDAINLVGCATAQTVIIEAGGQLFAGGDGVVEDADGVILDGAGTTLSNAGTITAWGSAIALVAPEAGVMTITNSGSMYGRVAGIWHKFGNGVVNFTNSGTVTSPAFSFLGGDSADNVTNSGSMVGTISLGYGNDSYDGRLGTVTGVVLGGGGNDMFVGGVGAESFDGGDGFDTISYATATYGMVIDLATPSLTRGSLASGDSLIGFEAAIGGTRADYLNGNSSDNLLNGAAGGDRIFGGAGADTVVGGNGIDRLTGGAGADLFVFATRKEFRDQIADFNSGEDRLHVNGAAIGLGSYSGALDASMFHSGVGNAAADLNDRLTFDTTSSTLWYDGDGSGSAFAAILVADLQDGAVLAVTDILII